MEMEPSVATANEDHVESEKLQRTDTVTVEENHKLEDTQELVVEEKEIQSYLHNVDLDREAGRTQSGMLSASLVDYRNPSELGSQGTETLCSVSPELLQSEYLQPSRALITSSDFKEADLHDDVSHYANKMPESEDELHAEPGAATVSSKFPYMPSVKFSCYDYKSQGGVYLPQAAPLQVESREKRYPSFLCGRKSVNVCDSTSSNGWRTLQKSPSRKANPEETYPALEPQVLDMMKELDESRKKFEREGNYIEANAVVERIQDLKNSEDYKRRAMMLERHMNEIELANKAFKVELDERNQLWDAQLKSFHKEVMEHAAELKRKHINLLKNFRSTMASKTPSKPQWSREILKLRKVQACLGKQGKYLDAQDIKQHADRMEQQELQATIEAYQNEVALKEQALRTKQRTELEVLFQRAAQARDELRKNKGKDLELCDMRHINVIREMHAMHAQECFRFDQLQGKKGEEKKILGRRQSPIKSVTCNAEIDAGENF